MLLHLQYLRVFIRHEIRLEQFRNGFLWNGPDHLIVRENELVRSDRLVLR